MPHPLSHKCSTPISTVYLTSHFMYVQIFHMVNINVPASVDTLPLTYNYTCLEYGNHSPEHYAIVIWCVLIQRLPDAVGWICILYVV